jgi:thiol-disulfide isomerase/thioredoxin
MTGPRAGGRARRRGAALALLLGLTASGACSGALAAGAAAGEPIRALPVLQAARPASKPGGEDRFARAVLQDPQGKAIPLAGYKGQVRVFDVWATWCGPCRMGIPEMNSIYEKYRSRGLTVIGLSVDDDPADVARFVREIPIHYPHGMMNPEIASLLEIGGGSMAIPITYVVDRTGRVRARFVGLVGPERISRLIESLL